MKDGLDSIERRLLNQSAIDKKSVGALGLRALEVHPRPSTVVCESEAALLDFTSLRSEVEMYFPLLEDTIDLQFFDEVTPPLSHTPAQNP